MGSVFFRVALIAASLGLDTFAVSVGIGMRQISLAARARVALSFATAEVVMTFIGTMIGKGVQHLIGDAAGYLGFAALVLVGLYMIIETLRGEDKELDLSHGWGLFIASLSISLDALGIGFSLPYLGVPLVWMLVAIAFASGSAAAIGLLLGRVFGARAGRNAGVFAGIVLVLTGATFGVLHYEHAGPE